MQKTKPLTIENRWDILYVDYPEIYDAFASVPKDPTMIDIINKHFKLHDKTILDIGSGSGESSFQLSTISKHVIGLEIEDNMRHIAEQKAKKLNIHNVSFHKGTALDISLPDQSVDASIAITLPLFIEDEIRMYIREALRVTKNGGYIINLGIAPFCYGGDLAEIILGESKVTEEDTEGVVDRILRDEFGFSYFDYEAIQTYDSIEHIVSTYGFIFGQQAIDYIRKTDKKHITWTYRIHYLMKSK
ncbi:MAG: methyltransferase domain-containing protein [Acholeplasmataceae bacterium]|jgi:ubiquinone/menaquinone biosynthesis C-methylase UbiE|nr:methyltransferase domain-containing protein [Acholeplasmataceae bacterium]